MAHTGTLHTEDDGHTATTRWPDWLWFLNVSSVVCLLSSLPYIVGWIAQTPDIRYIWVAVEAEDILSYFAKMGLGWQGQWLFHLSYTAQQHASVPIYTYYLFLGHLAHWFNISIPLTFHLARIVQGYILLLSVYVFIGRITSRLNERRFLFLLVCLSSGIMGIPESNTFYTLMDNPHFALSQTLLLFTTAMYLLRPPANWARCTVEMILMAVATGLLASLQPHMVVTALGIGAIYIVVRWWFDRRVPKYLVVRLISGSIAGLGVVGFTYLVLNSDAVLREWQSQNQTLSPSIWTYLIGYGLLLIPAVWGVSWSLRHKTNTGRLLLIWCLLTAVCIYAPTSLQRRLISGVHIPLAILAGFGIHEVWMARYKLSKLFAYLYLVSTCVVSLFLVAGYTRDVLARDPRLFVTANEYRAFEWLSGNAPYDAVVLSSPKLGSFIPAFTAQRVVVGHWAETVDMKDALPRVMRFYSAGANSFQRCADIEDWGVNYVLVGPRERDLGVAEDAFYDKTRFTETARFAEVSIYSTHCPQ